jgi:hypothetical protein
MSSKATFSSVFAEKNDASNTAVDAGGPVEPGLARGPLPCDPVPEPGLAQGGGSAPPHCMSLSP